MNILSWNCQGLGNLVTVRQLKEIIKQYDPGLVFLSETKNKEAYISGQCAKLGFDSYQVVDPVGVGGGLVVFWKNYVHIKILQKMRNIIDMNVTCGQLNFFISGVYGHPEKRFRQDVWERIMRIGVSRSDPWVLTGDFNEIRSNLEKEGGTPRSISSFQDFENLYHTCNLLDLQTSGGTFTWRGVRGKDVIRMRLDRSCANSSWFDAFPESNVVVVDSMGSDHKAIVTQMHGPKSPRGAGFRFDNRWLRKKEVRQLMEQNWTGCQLPTSLNEVRRKLEKCKRDIKRWSKGFRNNSANAIRDITQNILCQERRASDPIQLRKLMDQLELEVRREEHYWKLRCGANWMKSGDKHTKFFFACTKQRRQRNRILSLKNNVGVRKHRPSEMNEVCYSYFEELFKSSRGGNSEGQHITGIRKKVSTEMNRTLIRPLELAEIKEAVFGMDGEKAPGSDGLTAAFFQRYWDILGKSLLKAIQNFLSNKEPLRLINRTSITLIPKVSCVEGMQDLRPISLCSVLYKILSKILANRLKGCLPSLISENQSGFISGRAISDNVLIAHEALHKMKRDGGKNQRYMAVKLDMSKAYDRMEWDFLRNVMRTMGFHKKWIRWVMDCVCSVSYDVILNGCQAGHITPGRGLRQGDPISPYLFVLCSESFSGRLLEAEEVGSLSPFTFSKNGPSISHLLFADDALILCKASIREARTIRTILEEYGCDSGQLVNYNKCAISFSKGTDAGEITLIKETLNIRKDGGGGKYLGLPEAFGRSKKEMFNYIREAVQGRLNGWCGKFLTQAGKEILLKTVASALPSYAMSTFLLPKTLVQEITRDMARFWWSDSSGNKKIHWLSWDKLQEPKSEGGLGFKDLIDYNIAMLAKQAWRILMDPEALCSKVLKSVYFPKKGLLEAGLGSHPSWGWRSIHKGLCMMKDGLRWMVRDGKSIRVWYDDWIPSNPPLPAIDLVNGYSSDWTVNKLIDERTRTWDRGKLDEIFDSGTVQEILKIPLSRHGGQDVLRWHGESHGQYTVKSGYDFIRKAKRLATGQVTGGKPMYNKIWSLAIPMRLKIFAWKCSQDILQVRSNVEKKGILLDPNCLMCDTEKETVMHLLRDCLFAKDTWSLAPISIIMPINAGLSFGEWLIEVDRGVQAQKIKRGTELFVWVCWMIWLARNNLFFNGLKTHMVDVVKDAKEKMEEWLKAQDQPIQQETQVINGKEEKITLTPDRERKICSVDGSWISTNAPTGCGWAVWKDSGEIMEVGAVRGGPTRSALVTEALALRHAMEALLLHGHYSVIFILDCQVLVELLIRDKDHIELDAPLRDIRDLRDKFQSVEFLYEGRRWNSTADEIARQARSQPSNVYFCFARPSWLVSVQVPFVINA